MRIAGNLDQCGRSTTPTIWVSWWHVYFPVWVSIWNTEINVRLLMDMRTSTSLLFTVTETHTDGHSHAWGQVQLQVWGNNVCFDALGWFVWLGRTTLSGCVVDVCSGRITGVFSLLHWLVKQQLCRHTVKPELPFTWKDASPTISVWIVSVSLFPLPLSAAASLLWIHEWMKTFPLCNQIKKIDLLSVQQHWHAV